MNTLWSCLSKDLIEFQEREMNSRTTERKRWRCFIMVSYGRRVEESGTVVKTSQDWWHEKRGIIKDSLTRAGQDRMRESYECLFIIFGRLSISLRNLRVVVVVVGNKQRDPSHLFLCSTVPLFIECNINNMVPYAFLLIIIITTAALLLNSILLGYQTRARIMHLH